MSKFDKVKMDSDTRLLSEELTEIGGFQVLHQAWVWDGIRGESFSFVSLEVEQVPDDDLKRMASESGKVNSGSEFTIARNTDSGYTFVNFNFG